MSVVVDDSFSADTYGLLSEKLISIQINFVGNNGGCTFFCDFTSRFPLSVEMTIIIFVGAGRDLPQKPKKTSASRTKRGNSTKKTKSFIFILFLRNRMKKILGNFLYKYCTPLEWKGKI